MKFIKKYYGILIVIILFPLAINYFTNIVSWNDIWNNWWMVLFILLLLIAFPFFWNFYDSKKEINKNDKTVFRNLMDVLNKTDIDYILRDMRNNIPVHINQMIPIWNFLNDCQKTNNIIHDKKLNKLLENFKNALRKYSNKSAEYTAPLDRSEIIFGFDPEFKVMNDKLYGQRLNELDELASMAYTEYKILIEYAKSRDLDILTKTTNKQENHAI